MQLFKNKQLFAIICWHSMKSNASSNSFFLGFFIETRHSKKSISIGNRTRGQFLPVWQFSSCDSLPGTAYSSPGLEQWRSQTKAAHTAGERMLEVRAPPLTPGEVSGMGCAGPAFLGETSQGAASASTRVGIPRSPARWGSRCSQTCGDQALVLQRGHFHQGQSLAEGFPPSL